MIQVLKKMFNIGKEVDFSCIVVVYPAKNGSWRGFVHPYDITTEADTREKALTALNEMIEMYEEGLRKYNNPSYLRNKILSDEEDREVFHQVALDALEKQGSIDTSRYYAETKAVSVG